MKFKYNFFARKFTINDIYSINNLYFKITKIKRSKKQFTWQWLNLPGGEATIFLIEAKNKITGKTKVIGHHGLMRLRFCQNRKIYSVGKTENTMVDRNFRSSIIYPRYESKFKKQYEPSYHALFSTTGPQAAIRQRLAHGYIEIGEWMMLFLSSFSGFLGSIRDIFSKTDREYKIEIAKMNESITEKINFTNFWNQTKSFYPFTAMRENRDMFWRFIKNPYKKYFICILKEFKTNKIKGYLIYHLSPKSIFLAYVDDIIVSNGSSELYDQILRLSLAKFFLRGIFWLSLPFCLDNSLQTKSLFKSSKKFKSFILTTLHNLYRYLLKKNERKKSMMRWVNKDFSSLIDINSWYITAMQFEEGPQ